MTEREAEAEIGMRTWNLESWIRTLRELIRAQLSTTLTSTCVGGAEGADTDNANRSPSCTRGGTTRRTGWRPRASPLPSHVPQGSDQISPRPPHEMQSFRTGTSSGTVTPENASHGERCSSADSRRERSHSVDAATKQARIRSTAACSDGKSMATSSSNHPFRRASGIASTRFAARPSSRGRME